MAIAAPAMTGGRLMIAFTVPGAPQGKGGPSVERLREVLSYYPDSGFLYWRQEMGRRGKVGARAGSLSAQGYLVLGVDGMRNLFAHRIAWAIHQGAWPDGEIDHINGNRIDNRMQNLRVVATRQNHQNMRRARSDNKLGLLGVSPRGDRFRAQIQVDGKKRWLGEFDTAEAASAAYLAAKRVLHSHGTL